MTQQALATQQEPEATPQMALVATVRSDRFRSEIEQALPEGITPDRFVRVTVTALMQNAELAKLDRQSVYQALVKAAQDGLLPDGREAAIVGFGQKAQYMPMVGGLRKIAAEHGWSIRTAVVYDNDTFEHDPVEGTVFHRPARLGSERGEPIGAYAVAQHRDGRREIEVMAKEDIEKVRNVSRAKDSGPWKSWWERMAEKTPARRLFAKLPLDPADKRIARVLDASAVDVIDATNQLYGPAREQRALTSAAPSGDGAAEPSPAAPDAQPGSPQAAGGEPGDAGEDPPAVPDPTDDPEPTLPVGEVGADDPGAAVVTFGQYEGKTLAEIRALPDSATWFAWAMNNPAKVPAELYPRIEAFIAQDGGS